MTVTKNYQANVVEELIFHRRTIHKFPELKFEEFRTSEYVKNHLKKLGFSFKENIAKTGIACLIDSGHSGKTILVRADMDALPIFEENLVEYKSENVGCMHACGHDGHVAILLAIASELKLRLSEMIPKGRLLLIFQPAEEGGAGADLMVSEGILEEFGVDACFALHVWNHIDLGKIGVVDGPMMASVDEFKITVIGKSGHGAMPQHTVDPVLVGSHIVCALQSIVSRNVDPLDSCVVTVGSFHSGNAFNVISEKAELTGTVRTYSKKLHEEIEKKIRQIASGVAESFGALVEIEYTRIDKPTINDKKMSGIVREASRAILGEQSVTEENVRSMGGEDFSAFLEQRPGCYFFVGSRNEKKGFVNPHHSSKFDFDEDSLFIGFCVMKEVIRLYLES